MKKMDKKGFTLIELLVVVAIIGILAAIAIPQFAKYRERAAKASAISDAKNIANSLEAYYADYESFPTSITLTSNVVTFGTGDTFTLSKFNTLDGYGTIGGTAYSFSIVNTKYSKSVTYNSDNGGLDKDIWQ